MPAAGHRPSPARTRPRRAGLLLAGLLCLGLTPAAPAQEDRAMKEAQTQRRLEQVRKEISELSAARNTLSDERDATARQLREADQAVDRESRALSQLDEQIAAQEAELARTEAERSALEHRLASQRQALARLLRSAYALGRHEQLKLLLAQDRIDALARVMAYHRYIQRDRVTRIQSLLEQLKELADVVQRIQEQRSALDASLDAQRARIAELEGQRQQRRQLLAELDARYKDTETRLHTLGRDEKALHRLLEQLQDIFADIPDRLDAAVPFAQRKGKLPLPLAGKTLIAYGATLPDGRTSRGWLIQASSGAQVKAVAHGRVAFSDWLKGYGLIVIVDHGGGWMSLYAQNDSLRREVGDWVGPGDVLAHAGSSGGQSDAALYLELRRDGRPVDPRGWFAPR